MKKQIYTLIPLLGLCCASCRQTSFEEQMRKEVEHFNSEEAPVRTDEITVMDSMSWQASERTLTYYYTIEGVADRDAPFDSSEVVVMQELLADALRSDVKSRRYKEQCLTFVYCYYSKTSGNLLLKASVKPEDYQ